MGEPPYKGNPLLLPLLRAGDTPNQRWRQATCYEATFYEATLRYPFGQTGLTPTTFFFTFAFAQVMELFFTTGGEVG